MFHHTFVTGQQWSKLIGRFCSTHTAVFVTNRSKTPGLSGRLLVTAKRTVHSTHGILSIKFRSSFLWEAFSLFLTLFVFASLDFLRTEIRPDSTVLADVRPIVRRLARPYWIGEGASE